jgi:hypothetical protein
MRFDLKKASETAEDAARLRQEFDDKLTPLLKPWLLA